MKRAIIIVMDSVGIGELPDADAYGDAGSNTLGNLANAFPEGLYLPHLEALGLGRISPIKGVEPVPCPEGCFGKCAEVSKGKDTTTGHWEIAGLIKEEPFPVYPEGFPDEVLGRFVKEAGIEVLWNKPASGTEIIQRYGEEHLRTGKLIVYTSADSVFQIAVHEDLYPLEKLYDFCRIARGILSGRHEVARVIARPFIGQAGDFTRTVNRRDFSALPFDKTLLDIMVDEGLSVIGIGKIGDIFAHIGLTDEIHTHSNSECTEATINTIQTSKSDGLIFTNLVDFDMLYGHRNNVDGYKNALVEFDRTLPEILRALTDDDVVIITADHGCDPTTPGTDHSREYIPLLVYGRNLSQGVDLGRRSTFADIAQTIADFFGLAQMKNGTSFLDMCIRR